MALWILHAGASAENDPARDDNETQNQDFERAEHVGDVHGHAIVHDDNYING